MVRTYTNNPALSSSFRLQDAATLATAFRRPNANRPSEDGPSRTLSAARQQRQAQRNRRYSDAIPPENNAARQLPPVSIGSQAAAGSSSDYPPQRTQAQEMDEERGPWGFATAEEVEAAMSQLVDQASVERYLKEQERALKHQYNEELRRQMVENNSKRMQGNNGFSTVDRRQVQRQQSYQFSPNDDDPPWLRGNPQPKTGVRGAPTWTNPNQPQLRRQQSLPQGLNSYNNAPYNNYPSNTDNYNGFTNMAAQGRRRQVSPPDDYDPFGKGGGGAPLRDSQGRIVADRRKMRGAANGDAHSQNINMSTSVNGGLPSSTYQPYDYSSNGYSPGVGIGGVDPFAALSNGAAPSSYNNPSAAVHHTNSYPAASPYSNGAGITAGGGSEKDVHRQELLQQIEAKKRQRDEEIRREREEEDRERRKFEQHIARQKAEAEEEKRVAREKAAAMERKREEAAEQAKQQKQDAKRRQVDATINNASQNNRRQQDEPDDGLEWWERKQQRMKANEAAAPTLAAPQRRSARRNSFHMADSSSSSANPFAESDTEPKRRSAFADADSVVNGGDNSRSASRRSRRTPAPTSPSARRNSYKPSSAAQRNEGVMRQLSAMRERLSKEQVRVKSALRRNEYNADIFDNDNISVAPGELDSGDDLELPSLIQNAEAAAAHRHTPQRSRSSRSQRSTVASRRSHRGHGDGDDDDSATDQQLADMIRRNRSLLVSAKSNRQGSSRKNMGGFLSDGDDDGNGGRQQRR